MVHAFYAGMGGFVFDINHEAEKIVRDKPTPFRVTLTARGVSLLAKCGCQLPVISKDSIADKSKADSLAKLLVCVQAVWCLLQYIGRLASHLPVTLLELNTLGHAICALAIYVSWWHKPLDAKDPHVLSGDWLPPSCLQAYMLMCSDFDVGRFNRGNQDRHTVEYAPGLQSGVDKTVGPGDHPVELGPGQNLPGTSFSIRLIQFNPIQHKRRIWTSPFHFHTERWDEPVSQKLLLQQEDVRRWRSGNEAINQYDAVRAVTNRCTYLVTISA
jgi:hypothetical protein